MAEATPLQATEALHYLNERIPPALQLPIIGIVCGSGLNGLSNTVLLEPRYEVPYADIPHFPQSTGNPNQRRNRHPRSYAD